MASDFSGKKYCVTCIAPKNGLPSALQEGIKKANPREAHNPRRTIRTTIVVLPSPRSLFFSIERRPDCRFSPAVGQRNRRRLWQTTTTPIQGESIRQPYADVNSQLTYTRLSAGFNDEVLQVLFKYLLKSLVDLLSVPCSSLVSLLLIS